MNDVLYDILEDAQRSGKITLLQMLHSYQKVISKRKIIDYSEEGAEIYKTILYWGREKGVNWLSKYSETFNKPLSVLQLKDLDVNPSEPTDKPLPFQAPAEPISISLPSLKDFTKRKASPKTTLAQAFRDLQLRQKAWNAWLEYNKEILIEKTKLLKTQHKASKVQKAERCFAENIKRKVLAAWSKFNLIALRKQIAAQASKKLIESRFWKAWQKAFRKSEILKGMKFTAVFIHNQWLMKKVFLALTRNVHSSMLELIKVRKISEITNSNLLSKFIGYWKEFINYKLIGKILFLKSQKILVKNLRIRGIRYWQVGNEVVKNQKEKELTAGTHRNQSLILKVFNNWFSFLGEKTRKKIKIVQAVKTAEKNIQNFGFNWFKYICQELIKNRKEKLEVIRIYKLKKILDAWKDIRSKTLFTNFSGKNCVCYYYLFSGKPTDKIVFPNPCDVLNLRRYTATNNKLCTQIKKTLFNQLKSFTQKLKAHRKKFTSRRQVKIFSAWKIAIEKKTMYRYLLQKYLQKSKKTKLSRIVIKWQEKYSKIKSNKLKYKKLALSKRREKISKYFSSWHVKLQKRLRHKKENALVPLFYRYSTLNKFFDRWDFKLSKHKKLNELNHKAKLFLLQSLSNKYWDRWRKTFELSYKARLFSAHRIAVKYWERWRTMYELKRTSKIFLLKWLTSKAWKKVAKNSEEFNRVEMRVKKIKAVKMWRIVASQMKVKEVKLGEVLKNSSKFDQRNKFLLWKKIVIRRNKHKESYFQRDKYLKKLVVNILLRLVEEKSDFITKADRFREEKDGNILRRCLSKWKNVVDSSLENQVKAQQVRCNRAKYFLSKWRLYTETRQNINEKIEKFKKKESRMIKNLVFTKLKSFLELSAIKKQKLIISEQFSATHSKLRALLTWKLYKSRRSSKNQRRNFLLTKSKQKQRKIQLKIIFASWKLFATRKKNIRSTLYSHLIKSIKNLKKKSLKALLSYYKSNRSLYITFAKLSRKLLKFQQSKTIENLKLDSNHKSKISSILNSYLLAQSTKSLDKTIKCLAANSLLNKSQKLNELKSSNHLTSKIYRKYFNLLISHKKKSSSFKTIFKQNMSKVFAILDRKFKRSTFSLIFELLQRQKLKQKKITNELNISSLRRLLRAWHSFAETKSKLKYKKEIIEIKHESHKKSNYFSLWFQAFNTRIKGRKAAVNTLYSNLGRYFNLWLIELRIKEIEAKRRQKYLVYGFAGVQIYSEKTFQAKAHIQRLQIFESFKLMKKLFKDWNNYAVRKQQSKYIMLKYKQRLQKYVINALKSNYYIRLISKEVINRCQKNTTTQFLGKWYKRMKNRCKAKKMMKKALLVKYLARMQVAFDSFKPRSLHSSLEKTRAKQDYIETLRNRRFNKPESIQKAVDHYNSALTSRVFYAWDECISLYSIKRRRNFIHSVFLGWKISTRENSLLRKYLIESNLSDRYISSSRELNIGALKTLSPYGSFTSNN